MEKLIPHWLNTSSNELIRSRLTDASTGFHQQFDELILNGEVIAAFTKNYKSIISSITSYHDHTICFCLACVST